ncbi:MAG: hypothetical protein PUA70_02175 [Oribacterium sp.]|nr:hypothetical protein [Oribacterium sp.]
MLLAINWGTVSTVLIVILIILVIVLVALYFYGKKLTAQQKAQQPIIDANTQDASILVIDKKMMKLKEAIAAGVPKEVETQTPFYLKWQKLPVVKAKIGPRMFTLLCDPTVFAQIPVKKECKVSISGLYIRSIKSARGGLPKAPEKKKGIMDRAKDVVKGNKK